MKCVLVSNKAWVDNIAEACSGFIGATWVFLEDPSQLSIEKIRQIEPRYLFFPYWSRIVPKEIFENYECVMFHMTDLPFGRGGSPLQNLIVRGIYQTKITAFKCESGLDSGPVYLKRPLLLHGSAQEIYIRAGDIVKEMIREIIVKDIKPQPQVGEVTIFKRREPFQSEIPSGLGLQQIYDYIRMLDADGYPRAFIKVGGFKVEFSDAILEDGQVAASAKIVLDGEGCV